MMHKTQKGISLAEYMLIGSAVVVVCIAGLSLVGGQFNAELQGLKADLTQNVTAAKSQRELALAQQRQAREDATKQDSPGKICLENGDCVDLGAQGDEITTPIQTTGGNGSTATAAYAAQLKRMALDYSNIPDPNLRVQDQLNLLVKRAYEFAELQRAYENDLAKNNYVLSVEIAHKYHDALWEAWSEVKKPITALECAYTDPNCYMNIYTPQQTSHLTPEIMAVIEQATGQFDGSHLKYTEQTKQVAWKEEGQEGVNLDSNEFEDPESTQTQKEGDNVCDAAKGDCQS